MNNKITSPPRLQPSLIATARDGAQLAYKIYPGSGEARYALVHSLAMDASFWNRMLEDLCKYGDVLVYDCRGHGISSKTPGPYTGEQFADDLADLLDAVGWTSAIIAGASMGGCVSLAFADAYPEKVDALGLIDTTSWYGPEAPAQWEDRAQKALVSGLAGLIEFQKARWLSEGFRQANPNIVDEAVAIFLLNNVAAYAETCRMLGHFDKRDALSRISAPTSIIVGEEGYAAPVAMAEFMHQGINNSTISIFPGVRHLTPLECPELVAAKLGELAKNIRQA